MCKQTECCKCPEGKEQIFCGCECHKSKKLTWFEIGHVKDESGETEKVFEADFLSECLKEWIEKGYKSPEYFIDVWETDKEGLGYPLGDIKLEDWIFTDIKNF